MGKMLICFLISLLAFPFSIQLDAHSNNFSTVNQPHAFTSDFSNKEVDLKISYKKLHKYLREIEKLDMENQMIESINAENALEQLGSNFESNIKPFKKANFYHNNIEIEKASDSSKLVDNF